MTLLLTPLWLACTSSGTIDDTASIGTDSATPTDSAPPTDTDTDTGETTTPPGADSCAPRPAATGTVISITPASAGSLADLVAALQEGDTLELAAGTYPTAGDVWITTPGVTLRGATGDPADVVLDDEPLHASPDIGADEVVGR